MVSPVARSSVNTPTQPATITSTSSKGRWALLGAFVCMSIMLLSAMAGAVIGSLAIAAPALAPLPSTGHSGAGTALMSLPAFSTGPAARLTSTAASSPVHALSLPTASTSLQASEIPASAHSPSPAVSTAAAVSVAGVPAPVAHAAAAAPVGAAPHASLAPQPAVFASPAAAPLGVSLNGPWSIDLGQGVVFEATATGGAGGYVYDWTALPAGCANTNTADLACVPTASYPSGFTVTIQVTDAASSTALASSKVTVEPKLAITFTVSANPILTYQGVTVTATASGGTGAGTYDFYDLETGGVDWLCYPFPSGGTENSVTWNCAASSSGSGWFEASVEDANDVEVNNAYTYVVVEANLTGTLSVSGSEIAGQPLTFTTSGLDGVAPYTYAYKGLPTGCGSVNAASFTCTPTRAGTYSWIEVFVNDSSSLVRPGEFSPGVVTIDLGVVLTISPLAFDPSNDEFYMDYGQTVVASISVVGAAPGALTYNWDYDGTLGNGDLFGCSSTATDSTILCTPEDDWFGITPEVSVTDSQGNFGWASTDPVYVEAPVQASLSASSPNDVGQPISLSTDAYWGTSFSGYGYSYSGLPAGCASANVATLTCTPTVAGTFEVDVMVWDQANPHSYTNASTPLIINPLPTASEPTVWYDSYTHTSVDVGQVVEFNTSASGGSPGYTYAWSGMPASFSCPFLNNPDVFCVANSPGSFAVTITVTVTDSLGATSAPATLTVTLHVYADPKAGVAVSFSSGNNYVDEGQWVTGITSIVNPGSGVAGLWVVNGVCGNSTWGPQVTVSALCMATDDNESYYWGGITDLNGVSVETPTLSFEVGWTPELWDTCWVWADNNFNSGCYSESTDINIDAGQTFEFWTDAEAYSGPASAAWSGFPSYCAASNAVTEEYFYVTCVPTVSGTATFTATFSITDLAGVSTSLTDNLVVTIWNDPTWGNTSAKLVTSSGATLNDPGFQADEDQTFWLYVNFTTPVGLENAGWYNVWNQDDFDIGCFAYNCEIWCDNYHLQGSNDLNFQWVMECYAEDTGTQGLTFEVVDFLGYVIYTEVTFSVHSEPEVQSVTINSDLTCDGYMCGDQGGTYTLTATAEGGVTPYTTYSWYWTGVNPCSAKPTKTVSITCTVVQNSSTYGTFEFTVMVVDSLGYESTCDSFEVYFNPPPTVAGYYLYNETYESEAPVNGAATMAVDVGQALGIEMAINGGYQGGQVPTISAATWTGLAAGCTPNPASIGLGWALCEFSAPGTFSMTITTTWKDAFGVTSSSSEVLELTVQVAPDPSLGPVQAWAFGFPGPTTTTDEDQTTSFTASATSLGSGPEDFYWDWSGSADLSCDGDSELVWSMNGYCEFYDSGTETVTFYYEDTNGFEVSGSVTMTVSQDPGWWDGFLCPATSVTASFDYQDCQGSFDVGQTVYFADVFGWYAAGSATLTFSSVPSGCSWSTVAQSVQPPLAAATMVILTCTFSSAGSVDLTGISVNGTDPNHFWRIDNTCDDQCYSALKIVPAPLLGKIGASVSPVEQDTWVYFNLTVLNAGAGPENGNFVQWTLNGVSASECGNMENDEWDLPATTWYCDLNEYGLFSIQATYTDLNGVTVTSAPLNFTVYPPISLEWQDTPYEYDLTLTPYAYNVVVGEPDWVNVTFASENGVLEDGSGVLTYSWSGLPAGCTGLTTGSVTCTFATAGTYTIDYSMTVTDSNGYKCTASYLYSWDGDDQACAWNHYVTTPASPPNPWVIQVWPALTTAGIGSTYTTGDVDFGVGFYAWGVAGGYGGSTTSYGADDIASFQWNFPTTTSVECWNFDQWLPNDAGCNFEQPGVYTFTVGFQWYACDYADDQWGYCNEGGLVEYSPIVTATFTITVLADPAASPPTASSPSVDVGQSVTFKATVVFPGNGSDTYAWEGLPAGCASVNALSITCTPTAAALDLRIYVVVTDKNGVSSSTDAWSNPPVSGESGYIWYDVYDDPSVDGVWQSSSSIYANTAVAFEPEIADSGSGTIVSYAWTGLPAKLCNGTASVEPQCTLTTVGTFSATLTVSVTDSNGVTATYTATVTVTVLPDPVVTTPVASLGSADVGQTVVFNTTVINPPNSGAAVGWAQPGWPCTGSSNNLVLTCYMSAAGTFTVRAQISADGYTWYSGVLVFVVYADPSANTPSATVLGSVVGSADVGQDVVFHSNANGAPPFTYTWSGLPATGCTGITTSTPSCVLATAAVLSVSYVAVDGNGIATNPSPALQFIVYTDPVVSMPTSSVAANLLEAGVTTVLSVVATGGLGPYTFTWDGLPGTYSGNVISFTPGTAGTYTINVVVTDANHFVTAPSTSLVLLVAPRLAVNTPTAQPPYLDAGQTVNFSATASGGVGTDAYVWTGLPAGCALEATATPTCMDTPAGEYYVSVTVTDSAGIDATSGTLEVYVYPALHVTAAVTSTKANVGESVLFTGSVNGGSGPYTLSWSFGDGGTATNSSTVMIYDVSHVYAKAGTYTVTLTATDNQGATASSSIQITVSSNAIALAVSVAATPKSVAIGAPTMLSASAVGGVGPFSFTWTFGDGSGWVNSTTTHASSISHAYSTSATFTVTVWVNDSAGDSAMAQTTVTVGSPLTVAISLSANTVTPGTQITATATASGGTGTGYTYVWTVNGATVSGNGNSLTYTPQNSGSYVIGVTVTDSSGAQASQHATLTSEEPVGAQYDAATVAAWGIGAAALGLIVGILLIWFLVARRRRSSTAKAAQKSSTSGMGTASTSTSASSSKAGSDTSFDEDVSSSTDKEGDLPISSGKSS